MICPYCEEKIGRDKGRSILETRNTGDGEGLRRRRKCPKCGKIFWTEEYYSPAKHKEIVH